MDAAILAMVDSAMLLNPYEAAQIFFDAGDYATAGEIIYLNDPHFTDDNI